MGSNFARTKGWIVLDCVEDRVVTALTETDWLLSLTPEMSQMSTE